MVCVSSSESIQQHTSTEIKKSPQQNLKVSNIFNIVTSSLGVLSIFDVASLCYLLLCAINGMHPFGSKVLVAICKAVHVLVQQFSTNVSQEFLKYAISNYLDRDTGKFSLRSGSPSHPEADPVLVHGLLGTRLHSGR